MYNTALIALCVILMMGCDKKVSECEPRICTEIFVMANITFTKKDGTGVMVKDFSVVNMRTGDTLKNVGPAHHSLTPGIYTVVSDNHVKELSEEGDELKISGTYEATNQSKSAMVKVTGGKCACHIHKISGPDRVVFD